jgi:hypothetical protein
MWSWLIVLWMSRLKRWLLRNSSDYFSHKEARIYCGFFYVMPFTNQAVDIITLRATRVA